MAWYPVVTTVFMLPVAAHPYVVVAGRHGPITRVMDVGAVPPLPFAFHPYVTGGRAYRMNIHGFNRPNAHIEALGIGLMEGRKGQSKG